MTTVALDLEDKQSLINLEKYVIPFFHFIYKINGDISFSVSD